MRNKAYKSGHGFKPQAVESRVYKSPLIKMVGVKLIGE